MILKTNLNLNAPNNLGSLFVVGRMLILFSFLISIHFLDEQFFVFSMSCVCVTIRGPCALSKLNRMFFFLYLCFNYLIILEIFAKTKSELFSYFVAHFLDTNKKMNLFKLDENELKTKRLHLTLKKKFFI